MEADQIIIPTSSKAKISHLLSYPIGAERISNALGSSAQFSELKLHFYFWTDSHLRRGQYELLRVEYLKSASPAFEYPVTALYKRPPQYQWEIVVQPVPRPLRNKIKLFLVETALASVRDWLDARVDMNQQGSDILAFFYDEKDDAFVTRRLSHVEPHR